jgi:DNA-binding transcriptional ArsR family regulator
MKPAPISMLPLPAAGLRVSNLMRLQASAERACALLKGMAHADRLVLLCRLARGEASVGDLEAELGIRQPSLSQQLGVLRQEGLVGTRREGKRVFYRLVSADAAAVMEVLYERLCAAAPRRRAGRSRPAHE